MDSPTVRAELVEAFTSGTTAPLAKRRVCWLAVSCGVSGDFEESRLTSNKVQTYQVLASSLDRIRVVKEMAKRYS
jgi:hypothetical protein